MAETEQPEVVYQPKDALTHAVQGSLICGGAGLFAGAARVALARQNIGPWSVFTRTGSMIGVLAAMGGVFNFTQYASANLREKNDSLNPTVAGFLAGSLLGLQKRSFPATLGFGAGLAILNGAFDYTGGTLQGLGLAPQGEDDYGSKEWMRRNRRRPIQETLDELGEGRGIYGPGYRERRADRIKEAYGIDVPRT